MQARIPRDIRELISEAIADPVKRMSMLQSVEDYLDYLEQSDRSGEIEAFLDDQRRALSRDLAAIHKEKSRARFRVVYTVAPALIPVIAKVITDHMPFG